VKIGLVCSAGGHLTQLWWLRSWWSQHQRFWVSFDMLDARTRLADERVYWGHHPTNRSLPNAARNLVLARQVLERERPDVLVSNGAGIALPFFVVGRAMGIGLVFLEVYDRIDAPSLTGRLLRPLADEVVIQWEGQRAAYPEGRLLGPIW